MRQIALSFNKIIYSFVFPERTRKRPAPLLSSMLVRLASHWMKNKLNV